MRRWPLLVAWLVLGSAAPEAFGSPGWTVAAAVDGTGGLAGAARQRAVDLDESVRAGRAVVGTYAAGKPAGGKQEWLADVVAKGAQLAKGGPLLIAITGHGSGDLGGTAGLLSTEEDPGLTIGALSGSIALGLERGGRLRADAVVLEVCHTASLEVASELAKVSSCAVLTHGSLPRGALAWEATARWVADAADLGPVAAATELARRLTGLDVSELQWGLTVCDLRRVGAVVDALGAVSSLEDRRGLFWALAFVRGREVGSTPVRDLARAVQAGVEGAAEVGHCLGTAADDVVVDGWGGGHGGGGLGLYVPEPLGSRLEAYLGASSLPELTGYGKLLQAYRGYSERRLPLTGR